MGGKREQRLALPFLDEGGDAVQQQQRPGGAIAVELDVQVDPVEPHYVTAAGVSASATTRQIWRCNCTLRCRSVRTSTTCRPPRSSPSATAVPNERQSSS